MKRLFLAALALACLAVPAWADVALTSTWVQVASAGSSVQVQCRSTAPCVLQIAATAPSSSSNEGEVLQGGDWRPYAAALPNNLYARALGSATGYLAVNSIGATGGGSVSGTVTANQGTSGTSAWPVAQQGVTWTQTIVTLAAGTSATLITANASRKGLYFENTGASPCTVAPSAGAVTAGQGRNLNPSSQGAGYQGGSMDFTGEVSTQAFAAVSAAGTTVTVWEGQ